MDDTSTLIWGMIFGSIGVGFFIYGKKQKSVMPLISGLGLMVLPYLISNIYILVLSGIVFDSIAFFYKDINTLFCRYHLRLGKNTPTKHSKG